MAYTLHLINNSDHTHHSNTIMFYTIGILDMIRNTTCENKNEYPLKRAIDVIEFPNDGYSHKMHICEETTP